MSGNRAKKVDEVSMIMNMEIVGYDELVFVSEALRSFWYKA